MKRFLAALFLLIIQSISFAAPSEIVIVRHANKLDQKNHGPVLDPTGYKRAVHFAFYFLDKFGYPNFIIAANPNVKGHHVNSIRELQTIAPLANLLEQKNAKEEYQILDPYTVPEYPKLATWILEDERFNNKKVLVCWDHHTIPHLVNLLGVKESQPVWPESDFDSVYILHFNQDKLENYKFLHHQYPVAPIMSWKAFL